MFENGSPVGKEDWPDGGTATTGATAAIAATTTTTGTDTVPTATTATATATTTTTNGTGTGTTVFLLSTLRVYCSFLSTLHTYEP